MKEEKNVFCCQSATWELVLRYVLETGRRVVRHSGKAAQYAKYSLMDEYTSS